MSTLPLDTIVAGIRCRDVLADLSDYLDGTLAPTRVSAIEAHLAECENCARFGGHIAQTLTALRSVAPRRTGSVTELVVARIRGAT